MMNNNLPGNSIVHAPFRRTQFSRIWLAVKNWRNRRIAMRELSALPDAMLRDIGIERYQIEDVVNGCGTHAEILPLREATKEVVTAVKKAA